MLTRQLEAGGEQKAPASVGDRFNLLACAVLSSPRIRRSLSSTANINLQYPIMTPDDLQRQQTS